MAERLTLDVPEVAGLLGVSKQAVYGMAKTGRLPPVYVTRQRLVIPVTAVEALLGCPVPGDILAHRPRRRRKRDARAGA